jgi:hypothetical protein
VTDEKAPVEKAVELLVYAPVGMALYVRDMMPSMLGIFVARGKREVQSHRTPPPPPVAPPPIPDEVKRRIDESMGLARVVAEGGFGVARDVAGSGIGVARDVAGTALQSFLSLRNGDATAGPAPTAAAAETPETPATPATATGPEPQAAPPAPAPAPTPPAPSTAASDTSGTATSPSADSLPIPDYDELSASQVVERLDGLDADSLEAIRRYESEHRGRNTILGKIAQLS